MTQSVRLPGAICALLTLLSASFNFAGCSATMQDKYPIEAGWRRLEYVGPLEALPSRTAIFRDCRRDVPTGLEAASFIVLQGKIRKAPHFVVLQYWVVPAGPMREMKAGDPVFANELDCHAPIVRGPAA